jgi:CheY-like chemotaxis protein
MDTPHARILVVDDEPTLLRAMARKLKRMGFDVQAVGGGREALDAAAVNRFDLVICDLMMPEMDGVQTLRALKEIDAELEVVIATAYASLETAVNCLRAGACDYLGKPFEDQDLKQVVRRALDRRRLHGLGALVAAIETLRAPVSRETLIDRILGGGRSAVNACAAGLVLTCPGPEPEVHCRAEPKAPSTFFLRVLAELALERRQPLRLPNPAQEAPATFRAEDCSSALLYPLISNDHGLGALILLRRKSCSPFALCEEQKGTIFAAQAQSVLANLTVSVELAACQGRLRSVRAGTQPRGTPRPKPRGRRGS